MIADRRPVIRLGLRHHNNMIQQHIRIEVRRNQHVRRNHVPRMQLTQNARILQLVRHSHRIHEARNSLMIQRYLALGCIG